MVMVIVSMVAGTIKAHQKLNCMTACMVKDFLYSYTAKTEV